MKNGFVKIASYSPEIRVADTTYNANSIINTIKEAEKTGVEIAVFPELSLTASTCGDLFYSDVLLGGAIDGLKAIMEATKEKEILIFVGLPFKYLGRIYNVCAVINKGEVIGLVPKTAISEFGTSYQKRTFAVWGNENAEVQLFGKSVPFGKSLIFTSQTNKNLTIGVEIGEELYAIDCPSAKLSKAGASVIVNLSASGEVIGKKQARETYLKAQSVRLACAYAYADAGYGESTTDGVFGGHNLIAENGEILASSKLFAKDFALAEIDLDYLASERNKVLKEQTETVQVQTIVFNAESGLETSRTHRKTPFVPENQAERDERAELILTMQAEGLARRIEHTHSNCAVLGLSGGLDSTLAILVAVKAMKRLNRSAKDVIAITMPCFGTTSRTFLNTLKLAKALGVTLKKIDIGKAVTRHLKDIRHPEGVLDVTFENAQARERTQVIMDVANMMNGLVVGTGDLSEVALGWATYNGDHMSMYGVNASIPKTLVRHVVNYCAENSKGKQKAVLLDILDTPVSPELLPAKDGEISQKTEDIVGPYVLHDYFLYHFIRRGSSPKKIYALAKNTFKGEFTDETILKWLKIFFRRFFMQQFKRSCTPDGVKVGTVALSPRGDWRMPSDAISSLWLNELETL